MFCCMYVFVYMYIHTSIHNLAIHISFTKYVSFFISTSAYNFTVGRRVALSLDLIRQDYFFFFFFLEGIFHFFLLLFSIAPNPPFFWSYFPFFFFYNIFCLIFSFSGGWAR